MHQIIKKKYSFLNLKCFTIKKKTGELNTLLSNILKCEFYKDKCIKFEFISFISNIEANR